MYLFSLGSESPKGAIGHIVPTEKTVLAVERNKVLLPPLWNRTLSWGFDDYSCCLGSYGSDKVSTVGSTVYLLGEGGAGPCDSESLHLTSNPHSEVLSFCRLVVCSRSPLDWCWTWVHGSQGFRLKEHSCLLPDSRRSPSSHPMSALTLPTSPCCSQ